MINMPITFKSEGVMTDQEFFRFCQMNDTMEFERDAQHNIILISPTGSFTGGFNSKILIELGIWNKVAVTGEIFDSSTGFMLPNGAVRSPDVSWIKNERWNLLTQDQKEQFAPICPDFVIEIRSKSDGLTYLQDKMKEFIENGVQLGWLIDRFENNVYIYREDKTIEIIETLETTLSGEDVLPGFVLNLAAIIS
jgi:Uma2 family endonuclease